MYGRIRIKMIPVKHGDVIEVPARMVRVPYSSRTEPRETSVNTFLGFKPGRAGRAEGHLIFGVREGNTKLEVTKRRVAKTE